MALEEAMAALVKSTPVKSTACVMGRVLQKMTDADRELVQAWLADEEKTAGIISAALRTEGYPVKDQSVRRHRRGACAC
jgi:hypothetical protein